MPSCEEGRSPNRKTRNGRKNASGMLICMSGSLSTEESGRQKEAGRYGAWRAIQVSHSTALREPRRQRPCVRKRVLCCDRCTLQGPLGSYRTGFTYSEPITLIAFIWEIDEKKNMQSCLSFLRQTFCVLYFLFCPKADTSYIQVLFAPLREKTIRLLGFLPPPSQSGLPSDLTSSPHNKSSYLWCSVSCPQFIVFAFP